MQSCSTQDQGGVRWGAVARAMVARVRVARARAARAPASWAPAAWRWAWVARIWAWAARGWAACRWVWAAWAPADRPGRSGPGARRQDVDWPLYARHAGRGLRDRQRRVPGREHRGPGLAGVLTTDKTIRSAVRRVRPTRSRCTSRARSSRSTTAAWTRTDRTRRRRRLLRRRHAVNADAYNVYILRVTNPRRHRHQDRLSTRSRRPTKGDRAGPGVSNHTTYGIDYTAHDQGAWAAPPSAWSPPTPNCSMIKNCGPTQNDGNTCAGADHP